jgi:hypothetical protein
VVAHGWLCDWWPFMVFTGAVVLVRCPTSHELEFDEDANGDARHDCTSNYSLTTAPDGRE